MITWNYSTDYAHSIQSFKIYRHEPGNIAEPLNSNGSQNPGPAFTLVQTIRLQKAIDTAIAFSAIGEYACVDENPTKPTKDPILYRIIAHHRDGGTSEWSADIVID